MLDASHALIGASLARLFPNPYLGIPLAIASHFLADLSPHWDFNTRKTKRSLAKLIALSLSDAFVGFTLGWLLFSATVPTYYLLIMMFSAQLPDWLEAPYSVFGWNFPPFSSIKKLQSRLHWKKDLPWGLLIQIMLVSALVLYTLRS